MLQNSLPMQPNFKDLFPELPSDSRVWIYCSNRELSKDEAEKIQIKLSVFIKNWSTHGSAMTADSTILLDRFLVIAADEDRLAASGCSIDSSVRFIKQLGQEFNLDFFNRLMVYVLGEGEILRIPYHELHQDSGAYFDPLTNKLEVLRNSWPVPQR
jgi:hypothetical protein